MSGNISRYFKIRTQLHNVKQSPGESVHDFSKRVYEIIASLKYFTIDVDFDDVVMHCFAQNTLPVYRPALETFFMHCNRKIPTLQQVLDVLMDAERSLSADVPLPQASISKRTGTK